MKSRSLQNSTKKGFMIFFTVTLSPFMKYHSPPLFPSRNITKNVETHPPPMRNVTIEQPLSLITKTLQNEFCASIPASTKMFLELSVQCNHYHTSDWFIKNFSKRDRFQGFKIFFSAKLFTMVSFKKATNESENAIFRKVH